MARAGSKLASWHSTKVWTWACCNIKQRQEDCSGCKLHVAATHCLLVGPGLMCPLLLKHPKRNSLDLAS